MNKFNRVAWNEIRLKVEADIRAVKNGIRREDKPINRWDGTLKKWVATGLTYRGGTCNEWTALGALQIQATMLYRMRAAARGRAHRKVQYDLLVNGKWEKTDLDPKLEIQEALSFVDAWELWIKEVEGVSAVA